MRDGRFRNRRSTAQEPCEPFRSCSGQPKAYPRPYVSAVIDLDGGGQVKSNVIGVEPTLDNVKPGMKVRLDTYVAATDDEGTEAVAFGYTPV